MNKRRKINAFQIIGIIVGIITIKESISPTLIPSLKSYTYAVLDDGNVDLKGTVNYNIVSKFEFITLNVKNKSYYYLATSDALSNSYRDVFTNQKIYKESDDEYDVELISNEEISPYLISMNMIKDSYTKEDLETIYDYIMETNDYENKYQKVKVMN